MSSRASSERMRARDAAAAARAAACPCATLALAALVLSQLAACSSTPPRARTPAPAAASSANSAHSAAAAAGSSTAGTDAGAAPGATATGSAAGTTAAPAAVHPEVTPAARADFDRAVNYMRSGNATEAELGFKQVALQYPQFAAPLVNLAIMKRKDGHLDQAELLLKNAVEHESSNAVAWTELGATQSVRGEFKDAAASYHQSIDV